MSLGDNISPTWMTARLLDSLKRHHIIEKCVRLNNDVKLKDDSGSLTNYAKVQRLQ